MHTAAELDAKAKYDGTPVPWYAKDGIRHRFKHCRGGKDLMEAENEVEKLKKKGKPVPKD